ncbi:hypothetical protein Q5752_002902 [Cryptotrichosporon argae]
MADPGEPVPAEISDLVPLNVLESSLPAPLPPDKLLATPASITPDLLALSLAPLDTATAVAVCAKLVLTASTHVIKAAVELGLERASSEVQRLEERLIGRDVDAAALEDEAVVRSLAVLLDAQLKLETFHALAPTPATPPAPEPAPTEAVDIEIDDPWADEGGDVPPILDDPWETSPAKSARSTRSVASVKSTAPVTAAAFEDAAELPFDLSTFLRQPLETSALALAASANSSALRQLCERHSTWLHPFRLAILDAFPAWVSPGDADILALLPAVVEDGSEQPWPRCSSPPSVLDRIPASLRPPASDLVRHCSQTPDALAQWYTSRVLSLDAYGLLDVQLAWVQHGAALNVPSLDALGEDLSLLSRLIYDAHLLPIQLDRWSLSAWRAASEAQVVEAYLSASTSATVVADYRRLVLPYLYVLESRGERAGKADPGLVQRMLYDSILGLSLSLALPVFAASKATEPSHTRLVKDDMDVARLALACLYGARQLDGFATMSAIFECLPVWELTGRDGADDCELTSATLDALAAFVKPTVSGPPPAAKDLYLFFLPLPFASLSRALDILDVHLESGEILARWDTPVRLQFLLEIASDTDGQTKLAHRMVRRQTAAAPDDRRWIALWDDMRKLAGGDDALLRGAFGAIGIDDLVNIYLGGLLGSGNFGVAAKVIKRLQPNGLFSSRMLENAVLAASRDFYERAETANIHTGDMKLAYDCLDLAPANPAIRAERALIESTSKLTTFRALSSMSPAEVRHAPDRLDLVRRLLSTSDAFRHADLVLGLADGLGYAGDGAARAEVLGMLIDAALGADEFSIARERCVELVRMAREAPAPASAAGSPASDRIEDTAWKACLALGRRADWLDARARRDMLGHAIALAPADIVASILPFWRKAEDEVIARRAAGTLDATARAAAEAETSAAGAVWHAAATLAGLDDSTSTQTSPSRSSSANGERGFARAARLARELGHRLRDEAASPSPSLHLNVSSSVTNSVRPGLSSAGARAASAAGAAGIDLQGLQHGIGEEAERAKESARRALVKGVGWLLGADEGELG